MKSIARLCATLLGLHLVLSVAHAIGVPVTYQLPAGGDAPATYLVTLAITDPKNPDWIVSTFVAGEPRTVTKENKGKFTETWDGLDENFMPVPPGDYGVKGIYTPAREWIIDGEWHAITPLFAGGASPWLPSVDNPRQPVPFGGDPVNSPLCDVAVGPNGVGVFYYQYLENGLNAPMFDLNKPVNFDQFLRAFNSGGAAGGPCVATDGETVWGFSSDGGPKFVYRTDGKDFGTSTGANRRNCYLPAGWVTAMAAWRDSDAAKSYVYVAQRGKIDSEPRPGPRGAVRYRYEESDTEFVNEITIHDGGNGAILARKAIPLPLGMAVQGGKLYVLHGADGGMTVSSIELSGGLPTGEWKQIFSVPADIKPADFEVDHSGRYYLSDREANKVYQLDTKGKVTRTYGRLAVQKPGAYDPETFMAPAKLATWTDADGKDRLIIVEMAGPNRVTEWSADTGKLMREFMSYQTKCNNGYAIDPADASLIYLPGQAGWLTRFKINYDTHQWTVDAVWPGIEAGQRKGLDKPVAIRLDGRLYLASEQNLSIYRLASDGSRWMRSAGIVLKDKEAFLWNDANDNGTADDDELRPATLPGKVLTYHGQRWLSDLSYVAPAQGGRDLWRLAPEGFDVHGNPIFKQWTKVLTDPVFEARAAGSVSVLQGGNELADTFSSDWMQSDGSMADGFYVQARGGKNFTANYGAQHKITRYVPDGQGGYRLKWRVGRTALQGGAKRGEIQGGMRLFKPLNGLLTVVDQSRSGLFLYTEDGLYVDTLFSPGETKKQTGVYAQPGEFFAGSVYGNAANGKIYYGSGKYTPLLYEMQGWSLKENPVRTLATVQKTVAITAAQISTPPEIALTLRGGVGTTSVVRFSPALGGAELDGSLTGWESADPVTFSSGKDKTVEVRCLYDPETLFLRWHVRLGTAFAPTALPQLERIFTHDQLSDTVGFYIQGDVAAAPAKAAGGRPGDARFVFGIFKNGDAIKPAMVGLYPVLKNANARPQTYRTPVGEVTFEHVGAVPGVKMGHVIDADGKGFVIAAAIPRAAIPALAEAFDGSTRTLVNFDANLGGHDKFWWANVDGSASRETYDEPSEARLYPGSWAPAQFQGIADGVAVKNWRVLGPFGGPGAEAFKDDPQGPMKDAVRRFYEAATFPPDKGALDFSAQYQGDLVQGYWRDPGVIGWKPAELADLDTRIIVGHSAQVWYGATWIYASAPTKIEFVFGGHPMTTLRWFFNDTDISVSDKTYKDVGPLRLRTASREVALNAGWNQVHFRGYNVGYTPFRVGLVLKGPPENLWSLRFSNAPHPVSVAAAQTP